MSETAGHRYGVMSHPSPLLRLILRDMWHTPSSKRVKATNNLVPAMLFTQLVCDWNLL